MEPRSQEPTDEPQEPRNESPLDELFIVGARYHEPSAAERAAAAKKAERAAKAAEQQRIKEMRHTKRVLEGRDGDGDDGERQGYNRRTAMLGLFAIMAIAFALSFTAFAR